MSKKGIGAVLLLVAMLFLQVVVLDNVDINGYIVPYAYVLGIIAVSLRFGRAKAMFVAFAAGAVMDLFQQTGGLHAMACTLVAFVCMPLAKVFFGVHEKQPEEFDPLEAKSSRTAGLALLFVLLLLHHIVLYFFEVLNIGAVFSVLWHAMLNAAVSFVVSVVVLSLISIRGSRRKRSRL